MHRQCSNLVKVGGKPVHDYIEGIVEGEVVDDDGPDRRLGEHLQPWCSWGSALLLRFSRSQWDGCQPASSVNQSLTLPRVEDTDPACAFSHAACRSVQIILVKEQPHVY